MNTIYHWVGRIVVDGAIIFGSLTAFYFLRAAILPTAFGRYLCDAWEWVAVWLLGKRFLFPLEGARLLFTVDRAHKWPRWKRNLMAFNIRYSKRRGWKQLA